VFVGFSALVLRQPLSMQQLFGFALIGVGAAFVFQRP
jgi:uncharacterized protein (DUF486 family)